MLKKVEFAKEKAKEIQEMKYRKESSKKRKEEFKTRMQRKAKQLQEANKEFREINRAKIRENKRILLTKNQERSALVKSECKKNMETINNYKNSIAKANLNRRYLVQSQERKMRQNREKSFV